MKIYKVVPAAGSIVAKKHDSAQDTITKFFEVISQECVDGWEFHSMSPVNVTRKMSKFKVRQETYHAFIFVKELPEK